MDWQSSSLAQDYQKGQTLDLLDACRNPDGAWSCGGARGLNAQAGLFVSVPSGLLRATVARRTRMPSMKDRYSHKFGTAVPNPDLDAERSLTFETGYQGAVGARSTLHAAAFCSRIGDLIQRVYLQPNLSKQRNVGKASHAGFEADVRTRVVPRVDLSASYGFLDRRTRSDPAMIPTDTPRHRASLSADLAVRRAVRLIARAEFESGRITQDDAGALLDVPASRVFDVKGVWTLHRLLDVEVSVLNVFDASYWVAEGFPEPGRTMLLTARSRF